MHHFCVVLAKCNIQLALDTAKSDDFTTVANGDRTAVRQTDECPTAVRPFRNYPVGT